MTPQHDELKTIRRIEEAIEDAMWTSIENSDHEKALQQYELAKQQLESLEISQEHDRERKRVLSYCLMRINDALNNLGRSADSIEQANEVLRIAEESEDRVQTLRAKLALGIAFLNSGILPEAESHFGAIIKETMDEKEDKDVMQVYGWTLIVRVNILMGKSLYNQAEELVKRAIGVLIDIKNYAGLRTAFSIYARIDESNGDPDTAEAHRRMAEVYDYLAKMRRQ